MGAQIQLAAYLFNCLPTWKTSPESVAGAGEGNRTLVVSLEGFCSTIELHPRFFAQAATLPRSPNAAGAISNEIRRLSRLIISGGGGRIRTFEGMAGRFTVCSL